MGVFCGEIWISAQVLRLLVRRQPCHPNISLATELESGWLWVQSRAGALAVVAVGGCRVCLPWESVVSPALAFQFLPSRLCEEQEALCVFSSWDFSLM